MPVRADNISLMFLAKHKGEHGDQWSNFPEDAGFHGSYVSPGWCTGGMDKILLEFGFKEVNSL